jgi:hypothetical protein
MKLYFDFFKDFSCIGRFTLYNECIRKKERKKNGNDDSAGQGYVFFGDSKPG